MHAEPTPADHSVLALRIQAALLPTWWEALRPLVARYARRWVVTQQADGWIVRCELPNHSLAAFHRELARTWAAFEHAASDPMPN